MEDVNQMTLLAAYLTSYHMGQACYRVMLRPLVEAIYTSQHSTLKQQ